MVVYIDAHRGRFGVEPICHLALAYMWFDPERALAMIPVARELNQSLGESVGLAQCDMAAAVANAFRNHWDDSWRLLGEARRGFETVGAEFELIPVEPVEVLLHLASESAAKALTQTRRLTTAAQAGEPRGTPRTAGVGGN